MSNSKPSSTCETNRKKEEGFVLPLSVFLNFLLTLSGTNFMFFYFTEGRLTRTELDNQTAFYLANTGIERARETFKLPPSGNWTSVLQGTYDGNGDGQADYPVDPNPTFCPTCLCGPNQASGCVIPSFGDVVTTGLPFDGLFGVGQYQMRAFNNETTVDAEGRPVDTDRRLTYRAVGLVNGQQKMIELQNVQAKTGMRVIICLKDPDDPSDVCPDGLNENMELIYMEGREPASVSALPTWDQNYYREESNLPCSAVQDITGTATLVPSNPKPGETLLQSGTCYFITGDVNIKSAGTDPATGQAWNNIVIFSDQKLLVNGGATFMNTILIALSDIQLQGNITLSSPKTPDYFPALISGDDITKGDASVTIIGSIFALGSIGDEQHPWNPNQVTGTISGDDVYLKAASTTVTDNNDENYYDPMPGFTYPPELLSNQQVGTNSWRELE